MLKWNWRKSRIIFPRKNEHLVPFDFRQWQTDRAQCKIVYLNKIDNDWS